MSERKDIKTIIKPEADLNQKIDGWQGIKTNKELHVKYDPSKKTSVTHLDAIQADVNESEGVIKGFLKTQIKAENLIQQNLAELSGLQGLSFSTETDAKKESEFRKKVKEERERELREETEIKK